MQRTIYLFILLSFTAISCEDDATLLTELPKELIDQTWIHVHEEDLNNLETYRPAATTTLGPSWYRQTFLFKADQSCDYLVLAPNDAHFEETGYWRFEKGSIQVYNTQDELQHSLEIIDWSESEVIVSR